MSTTTTELTQEEKRALIAKACKIDEWVIMKRGLYYRENACGYAGSISEAWRLPKIQAQQYAYPHDEPVTIHAAPLPDYFHDLNAMHEAEKALTDAQRTEYTETLYRLIPAAECCISASYDGVQDFDGYFGLLHAKSAYRAEAFGKALNLWP